MTEHKTITITAQANPGIYGHDELGNRWATFETVNGAQRCDECGATISRGWVRGRWGEANIYVCSAHVIVTYE